jgi:hypothetical protein
MSADCRLDVSWKSRTSSPSSSISPLEGAVMRQHVPQGFSLEGGASISELQIAMNEVV